jgi:hypothetical protein
MPKPLSPTVESFSVALDGLEAVLYAPSPSRWLEAQLLSRLDRPIRLLRWAIVHVERTSDGNPTSRFHCEGAYLRRPSPPDTSNN